MTALDLAGAIIRPDDQVGLAALARAHTATFSVQDEKPWTIDSIKGLLLSAGMQAVLYSAGTEVVGFAFFRSVLDEAELISIGVVPARQGAGAAGAIMKDLLCRLKKSGVVSFFLEVRSDNRPAIILYEKTGFQKIGERKDYYLTVSGKRIDAFSFSMNIE